MSTVSPVVVVTGRLVPLGRDDVDTDQIVPQRYLTLSRDRIAEGLFGDWRADPGFVLNDPRYADGGLLVAGDNFGGGSSREHAVWALVDHGFAAVVATGFADIFHDNAVRNGLVPARVDPVALAQLLHAGRCGAVASVDLRAQTVALDEGPTVPFSVAEHARQALLHGLDDIDLTSRHQAAIHAHEQARDRRYPWLA